MNPYRPRRLMAVPPTLHARMEIAKALQSLVAEEIDDRVRRHAEIGAIRRDLGEIPELLREAFGEFRVLLAAELRKYSPDQPGVVLRDGNGMVIAVWDVKTGKAGLTPARVREIREHLEMLDDVPIFELHIRRGALRKKIEDAYGLERSARCVVK